ncbi:serine/threonine-protein kinase STN7, chloroplastic [Cryptomeria japonica]|uniref:serine/threonine-protein kinase STN7, chloroplastic n=1 Tax=Cryptomeria japonica TaxID=3369 RepID=UPI0025AC8019|nr:serine/threonine-protein kinase STN7, chloroplastic [Cryptomeria japonica]
MEANLAINVLKRSLLTSRDSHLSLIVLQNECSFQKYRQFRKPSIHVYNASQSNLFIYSYVLLFRYAAPEQYIMSTQTPSAPPVPVAAALSPVLWQMNLPDRFDIYSTGLIYLQMAFPPLRTDSSLIQFNRQLKRCGYDMAAWRETVETRASPELRRAFDLMDLDGGIGWELLLSMVRFKGRQRISAKGALAHPYFVRQGLLALSSMQRLRLQLIRATEQDYNEAYQWITRLMAKSGTMAAGGFTEAKLQELREIRPKNKSTVQRNALASALRLQRKIVKTLDESIDEIRNNRKSIWWRRWIPREE